MCALQGRAKSESFFLLDLRRAQVQKENKGALCGVKILDPNFNYMVH